MPEEFVSILDGAADSITTQLGDRVGINYLLLVTVPDGDGGTHFNVCTNLDPSNLEWVLENMMKDVNDGEYHAD
jgi:hypothetical protein